jgi:hypothetical protein
MKTVYVIQVCYISDFKHPCDESLIALVGKHAVGPDVRNLMFQWDSKFRDQAEKCYADLLALRESGAKSLVGCSIYYSVREGLMVPKSPKRKGKKS